ncbi:MAG TPA: hypothetical protein VI895_13180 [Bdellovibrionota bacterium]|nr:hypothetical protein [Bdellovibrionota bacterium]
MTSRIYTIFCSQARTAVLQTLYRQSRPIPLRHVAYLSQSPVYSVQRALKQLQREYRVVRKQEGNRVLFALNTRHPDFSFLSRILEAAANAALEQRTVTYASPARRGLDFADSALEFYRRVGTNDAIRTPPRRD